MTARSASDPASRFDLYRSAHKGVRKALFDAVTRIGAADCRDAAAASAAAGIARSLVALSRKHIGSEMRFIHPAVEARAPGLLADLDHAHDDHARQLDALEAIARDLEAARDAAARVTLGGRLYEMLSLFVAAELAHMAQEEQAIMPELWRLFSDEELLAMQQAIIAALGPDGLAMFLRPMLPAMNPTERERMLGGLKHGLPPEQWDGVWTLAGSVLNASALADLSAALDPSGTSAPVARKLLQIDFAYAGPWARDMAVALRPLAEEIASMPGLCWKIWIEDETARRAGGIYLFADQNALEAYLRRHTERLAALGIRDVEVRVRDVNDALGAISRAPLAA